MILLCNYFKEYICKIKIEMVCEVLCSLHFQSLAVCKLLTLNVVEVNLPAKSPKILVLKNS